MSTITTTKPNDPKKPSASIVHLRAKETHAAMAAIGEALDCLEPMGRDFDGVNRSRAAMLKAIQCMRDAGLTSLGGG